MDGVESELIQRARSIASAIDAETLQREGLWRDRRQYFLNIAYPSLQAMNAMAAEDVFEGLTERPRRVALYVHIPFCTGRCNYCHYYILGMQKDAVVDAYLDALEREFALYADRLADGNRIEVASLYVGGGTPTSLSAEQLGRLFESIHAHFTIPARTEVSMETHPTSTTEEKLGLLKRSGVNRLSMGVESFDDGMLKLLMRRHTAAQAVEAYELARAGGFRNINLDLIYGLPDETLTSWEANLNRLVELGPESFSAYFYRLKEGTGLHYLHQRQPERFPDETQALLMHIMTMERAAQAGYRQKLADWYVRADEYYHTYQDHNWGQGETVPLLGTGASAYGYLNHAQYYNQNDVRRYTTALAQGRLPVWRGARLDVRERMHRALFLGIKSGVSTDYFQRAFGQKPRDAFPDVLAKLEKLGLVEDANGVLRLTYLGNLFADEVGRAFYSPVVKQKMLGLSPLRISTTHPDLNPA